MSIVYENGSCFKTCFIETSDNLKICSLMKSDEPEFLGSITIDDDDDEVQIVENARCPLKIKEIFPCSISEGCRKGAKMDEPKHLLRCLLIKVLKENVPRKIHIEEMCTILSMRYTFFYQLPIYELVKSIRKVIASKKFVQNYRIALNANEYCVLLPDENEILSLDSEDEDAVCIKSEESAICEALEGINENRNIKVCTEKHVNDSSGIECVSRRNVIEFMPYRNEPMQFQNVSSTTRTSPFQSVSPSPLYLRSESVQTSPNFINNNIENIAPALSSPIVNNNFQFSPTHVAHNRDHYVPSTLSRQHRKSTPYARPTDSVWSPHNNLRVQAAYHISNTVEDLLSQNSKAIYSSTLNRSHTQVESSFLNTAHFSSSYQFNTSSATRNSERLPDFDSNAESTLNSSDEGRLVIDEGFEDVSRVDSTSRFTSSESTPRLTPKSVNVYVMEEERDSRNMNFQAVPEKNNPPVLKRKMGVHKNISLKFVIYNYVKKMNMKSFSIHDVKHIHNSRSATNSGIKQVLSSCLKTNEGKLFKRNVDRNWELLEFVFEKPSLLYIFAQTLRSRKLSYNEIIDQIFSQHPEFKAEENLARFLVKDYLEKYCIKFTGATGIYWMLSEDNYNIIWQKEQCWY